MRDLMRVIVALSLMFSLTGGAWTGVATKVDLNSANRKQLESLPGIGPALAERIVQYREKNGRFKRIEELLNVKGIGEKKFLRLKDFVLVTQATPKSTVRKN